MAVNIAPNTRRLLRLAGAILWMTSGVPAVVVLARLSSVMGATAPAMWAGGFALFGIAFWYSTADLDRPRPPARRAELLVVQSAAALMMFYIACTGFESALLVLVAALLGLSMPIAVAIPWILAQTLAMGWLGTYHWPPAYAVWWSAGALGMQVFGVLIASFAAREVKARAELSRANAELRAARSLLAHSSRAAERVRISRDLHDLIGHHLAGLSLNLEVASHTAGDRAREPIEKARAATKQLLTDVREAVSALREAPELDFGEALRALVAGVDGPAVHVDAPDDLDVGDAERAHVLTRTAQEIVTNTLRHAGADNLWLSLSRCDGGVELEAFDDGRGADSIAAGNGLRGMRERLEAAGGRLDYGADPGRGFWVRAWVPA